MHTHTFLKQNTAILRIFLAQLSWGNIADYFHYVSKTSQPGTHTFIAAVNLQNFLSDLLERQGKSR